MRYVRRFRKFLSYEVNPSQAQLQTLHHNISDVKRFLHRNLDSCRSVKLQGSYVLQTTIKPVGNREYDADILVYMNTVAGKKPEDYINSVYDCFQRNNAYSQLTQKKTRAVVVEYSNNFHIDVVPCIRKDGDLYVCNRKNNTLEITDGTGYREWFHRKARITSGNFIRVARLLKYLRDHKGNFEAPSVLLTTLIGHSIDANDDSSKFKTIPDTLKIVSNRINAFLQANPDRFEVRNPELRAEHYTRHWEQADYWNFREKFEVYTGKINDAYDDTDQQSSLRKWQSLFGDNFGKLKR